MSDAANYTARKTMSDGVAVVRLTDAAHGMEVFVAPSIGNNAYSMTVRGTPVLWWPYQSLKQFEDKPVLLGIPFLGPWANRLDEEAFYANGQKYLLNPNLQNYRYDGYHQPIHGLLNYVKDWEVTQVQADQDAAQVTSRLEFWRHPGWMAQFPFAHTLEMTHRLRDGVLEVRTTVFNYSTEPMPLVIGFHPYYQIADAPRDEWTVHLAAHSHYQLSNKTLPTGESTPLDLPDPVRLSGRQLDDVFGQLDPADEFWVKGRNQKITIRYGSRYTVAVVYAPSGRDFICFEPMTGITNGSNLAQRGIYKELQSVPAGGQWQESFWVKPTGY